MLCKSFIAAMPSRELAPLAIAFASVLMPAAALGQTTTPDLPKEPPTQLGELTVTATRTPRGTDNVPNTVTVLPAEAIEKSGARDIKDLLRNEIDLTVRAAPGRFTAAGSSVGRAGNEGINIRGLEGNQVLLLVDGIRVPNSFSFGAFATGRGDFLALDGVQSIELLRGPTSSQYGSDGLAGALSLRTLEPMDLLKPGRDLAGFVRFGYAQIDSSAGATVALAGRSGDWQTLLLAGARSGHETDNQGTLDALNISRTTPNPTDYRRHTLLGKVFLNVDAAHRVGATIEVLRHRQDTEVYSARALPPVPPAVLAATATLDLDARDQIDRQRVSLEHRYADLNALHVQQIETRVYAQDAEVNQFSTEDRFTAADRIRDNRYRQKVMGVSTQLQSNFSGVVTQRLSYGLDLSRSQISGVRDGTVAPLGETFPTKPFPDTRYTLAGAFVQDEIEAGAFSVIPALRFDSYKLAPSTDGFIGPATELSDQAVTPRLGVVWRWIDWFSPFAQLARGFRAPTPDQVNNGFTNVTAGYQSIGNPNLRPEHVAGLEAGFRGRWSGLRYSVVGYDNRYKDFISQEIVAGTGVPNVDPLIFQYINLAKARIRGVELRGQWRFDQRWLLSGGSALSRGYSERAGTRTPLNTVEPLRSVLGLRYDAGAWELRSQLLHSQGKAANRIAPATAPPFAPPAYTVLDLGASFKALPNLTLVANLNNVFDKTYWRWSDARGLADVSVVKDAYTAPGRNVQVSLRYDY